MVARRITEHRIGRPSQREAERERLDFTDSRHSALTSSPAVLATLARRSRAISIDAHQASRLDMNVSARWSQENSDDATLGEEEMVSVRHEVEHPLCQVSRRLALGATKASNARSPSCTSGGHRSHVRPSSSPKSALEGSVGNHHPARLPGRGRNSTPPRIRSTGASEDAPPCRRRASFSGMSVHPFSRPRHSSRWPRV